MMKKSVKSLFGVVMFTLVLCSSSFALDVPSGVSGDQTMSEQAFESMKQQYSALRDQLTMMSQGMAPDQQVMIQQVITVLDSKLTNLDHIEIYFAEENTPGDAYDTIYQYYVDNGVQFQNVEGDEVVYAVTQLSPGMVPQPTIDQITALAQSGKLKGANGGSGNSRISLLTVYLNPQTMELIEGTTLVIAVNK